MLYSSHLISLQITLYIKVILGYKRCPKYGNSIRIK